MSVAWAEQPCPYVKVQELEDAELPAMPMHFNCGAGSEKCPCSPTGFFYCGWERGSGVLWQVLTLLCPITVWCKGLVGSYCS